MGCVRDSTLTVANEMDHLPLLVPVWAVMMDRNTQSTFSNVQHILYILYILYTIHNEAQWRNYEMVFTVRGEIVNIEGVV